MLNLILLQAQQSGKGAMISQFVFIGGIVIVFYFFMIRPQQKKQKDLQKFRDSIKVGDKVVTLGGAYGTIVSIEDNIVFLEVDRGVKIQFDKSSIAAEVSKK